MQGGSKNSIRCWAAVPCPAQPGAPLLSAHLLACAAHWFSINAQPGTSRRAETAHPTCWRRRRHCLPRLVGQGAQSRLRVMGGERGWCAGRHAAAANTEWLETVRGLAHHRRRLRLHCRPAHAHTISLQDGSVMLPSGGGGERYLESDVAELRLHCTRADCRHPHICKRQGGSGRTHRQAR